MSTQSRKLQGILAVIGIWGGTTLNTLNAGGTLAGFLLLFIGGFAVGVLIYAAEKGDRRR